MNFCRVSIFAHETTKSNILVGICKFLWDQRRWIFNQLEFEVCKLGISGPKWSWEGFSCHNFFLRDFWKIWSSKSFCKIFPDLAEYLISFCSVQPYLKSFFDMIIMVKIYCQPKLEPVTRKIDRLRCTTTEQRWRCQKTYQVWTCLLGNGSKKPSGSFQFQNKQIG